MFCGVQNFTWLSTTMGVIRSWLPSRSGRYNGLDAVKGHTLHSKMTLTPYCLHVPIRIFKQKFARKLSKTEIPPRQTVRWSGRQSAAVVRTSSECVRGVDLAVRRRIKWLIGGLGGEKVWSGQPSTLSWFPFSPPPSLSLPQPGEKAIGAEQTNHMAIKHYSPLLHWDFIQTAFYWSLQCAHTHIQRRTHTIWTHTCAHANIHTAESPHQHDSGFTSPHSVRSLIPRVALEQHQQCERREKGREGQFNYWTASVPLCREGCQ